MLEFKCFPAYLNNHLDLNARIPYNINPKSPDLNPTLRLLDLDPRNRSKHEKLKPLPRKPIIAIAKYLGTPYTPDLNPKPRKCSRRSCGKALRDEQRPSKPFTWTPKPGFLSPRSPYTSPYICLKQTVSPHIPHLGPRSM